MNVPAAVSMMRCRVSVTRVITLVTATTRRALIATAPLRAAATFFALAVLVHNSDHLRRGGDSVAADVFWVGSAALLLEVGIVLLVYMRHPAAPLLATAIG